MAACAGAEQYSRLSNISGEIAQLGVDPSTNQHDTIIYTEFAIKIMKPPFDLPKKEENDAMKPLCRQELGAGFGQGGDIWWYMRRIHNVYILYLHEYIYIYIIHIETSNQIVAIHRFYPDLIYFYSILLSFVIKSILVILGSWHGSRSFDW